MRNEIVGAANETFFCLKKKQPIVIESQENGNHSLIQHFKLFFITPDSC